MGEEEIAARAGRDVVTLRNTLASLKHLQCKRRQMSESLDTAKQLLDNPSKQIWEAANPMEWFDKDDLFKVMRDIEETEKRIAALRKQFEDLM